MRNAAKVFSGASLPAPRCAIQRGSGLQERLAERTQAGEPQFWAELKAGVRFVVRKRVLAALAIVMAVWQMCHHAAGLAQVLIATRTLGLSEQQVGQCYVAMGLVSISASVFGHRLSANELSLSARMWTSIRLSIELSPRTRLGDPPAFLEREGPRGRPRYQH